MIVACFTDQIVLVSIFHWLTVYVERARVSGADSLAEVNAH